MNRERPELGAFVQNMNDTSAQSNATTLGVRLKVPFSYDPVNRPKISRPLFSWRRRVSGPGKSRSVKLLRARLQLYEADLARATARVAVECAHPDKNQALGLEP